MRLRHIEVFNAVMLTGSVSGAARLINVTQPAVSRTLQHAELQLGFPLFHRSRNRLVPTAEALALYPHVEALFGQLEQVQRLSGTLKAGREVKELRVACILTLGHEVLPRALTLFARRFPGVSVAVKTMHSAQMVPALVLQEADVGFLYSPAAHPALALEPVGQTRMMAVACRGSLPARALRRGSVSLQELAGTPVIGLDGHDPLGTMLHQTCREQGVDLAGPATVQTYHAALALARHGLGVAVVDGCTALSAAGHALDVLPLAPEMPVAVQAARPASRPGSVAVGAFIQAVQQVLAEAFAPPKALAAAASPAAPSPRQAAAMPSRKRG